MNGLERHTITRRSFLQASAAATMVGASGALTGCATNQHAEITQSGIGQVIVIGAGMAGLTAARTLQNAGYGVVVLEASNRVGGRIHTDRSLGAPLELGASRIGGTKKNPLIPFIDASGVDYIPFEWDNLYGRNSEGVELNPERLNNAKGDLFRIFARAVIRNIGKKHDQTVEDVIQHERDKRDLDAEENLILNFSLASAEIANGLPFNESSWKLVREYEEYKGDVQMAVNGLDALPKHLASDLDIRHNQHVRSIDYSGKKVRVTTKAKTFEADFTVLTVSLGVLQANAIEFLPELPDEKQDAIGRIGMGNSNTLGLRFPKVFWPEDAHAIVHGSETIGKYSAFVNIARYTGEPILMGMIPGTYRDGLEGIAKDTIAREAHAVLQGMFGPNTPAPTKVVRTEWKSDPLYRGAMSFNKFGAEAEDRDKLGESVDHKIFFAGEATHPNKYGSVAGAYLSGERVAREILQATSISSMT
jgi:monoamine oxidase